MVTTITLNPMLDKTIYVDRLERGTIHRALKMEMVAGGKGINVSRQLKRLGINTIATGFLGGEVGSIVLRLLTEESMEHDFVRTQAATREGLTYLEPDGAWTAMFEPPLRVEQSSAHELSRKIGELASKSTWIVCGGSSPGDEADEIFYEAIVLAHRNGISSVLDSYGRAFELGLKAKPTMVKPNKREFEMTFHQSLTTESDHVRAVQFLLEQGAQYSILTNGGHMFYAGIQGHFWKVTPPPTKAVNPTGSGDALVAGILYGFHQGWKFERCLAFGAAAGAANARVWEVANTNLQEILSLESSVKIQRVSVKK
ncbi:MAG: 1-phosphofructokinase family hexose kinase [Ignavibacteriales bacterium]|nr:1-phosphofructokinase family hexose kinase [Ignavibacteriales bacterium]